MWCLHTLMFVASFASPEWGCLHHSSLPAKSDIDGCVMMKFLVKWRRLHVPHIKCHRNIISRLKVIWKMPALPYVTSAHFIVIRGNKCLLFQTACQQWWTSCFLYRISSSVEISVSPYNVLAKLPFVCLLVLWTTRELKNGNVSLHLFTSVPLFLSSVTDYSIFLVFWLPGALISYFLLIEVMIMKCLYANDCFLIGSQKGNARSQCDNKKLWTCSFMCYYPEHSKYVVKSLKITPFFINWGISYH